ncbi:WXG100 family type VII secretion target [Nocardia sp. NPDC003345]
MAIHVNYGGVEDASARTKTVVETMNQNLDDLRGLKDMLMTEFAGSGAEGYQAIANELNRRLDNYAISIQGLNQKVWEVAASQGLFQTTDKGIGSKFAGLA